MRSSSIPFKIDLSDLAKRAKKQTIGRVGEVTLNLPFVSIAMSPKDREKEIARELVIRMKDRRVLSAWECCDRCIDHALKSLGEIRQFLVDKQVELANADDSPLYLILDAMVLAIRQFMTHEELLRTSEIPSPVRSKFADFRRPLDTQQAYFDALELLRGHLSRCLGQVALIAGMEVPSEGLVSKYQGPWQLEAYVVPIDEEH